MSKPVVAIVGRPNVGKSSLFNTLYGERISIVHDTPGVTRDRIYANAVWREREFTMIDTGGIEPESSDVILQGMRLQAEIAMETADVILFMKKSSQVQMRRSLSYLMDASWDSCRLCSWDLSLKI